MVSLFISYVYKTADGSTGFGSMTIANANRWIRPDDIDELDRRIRERAPYAVEQIVILNIMRLDDPAENALQDRPDAVTSEQDREGDT